MVQRGEINVFEAHEMVTISGIFSGISMVGLNRLVINKVNSATWLSAGPRTYLCTAADYEYFDHTNSNKKARYSFEFEYRPGGWDPTVYFFDEKTGKAPAGLVEDTGYKTIRYYEELDFNVYFPVFA